MLTVLFITIFILTAKTLIPGINILETEKSTISPTPAKIVTTPTITPTVSPIPSVKPALSASRNSFFSPGFANNLVIEEKESPNRSSSRDFWLNSGGQFLVGGGIGRTIQGELTEGTRWRDIYNSTNPQDTDQGKHPQNIFRLVTKSVWKNYSEQVYFKINADNLSSSPNRNSSNGIFLFNRYQDGDNLYYVGIRVDGNIVVKKKYGGIYYTMGESQFFPGSYDPSGSPNLLPKNTWIGIRSNVSNAGEGVTITVFIDPSSNGDWRKALEIHDSSPGRLVNAGYGGIRSDFMDLEFKGFRIEGL